MDHGSEQKAGQNETALVQTKVNQGPVCLPSVTVFDDSSDFRSKYMELQTIILTLNSK